MYVHHTLSLPLSFTRYLPLCLLYQQSIFYFALLYFHPLYLPFLSAICSFFLLNLSYSCPTCQCLSLPLSLSPSLETPRRNPFLPLPPPSGPPSNPLSSGCLDFPSCPSLASRGESGIHREARLSLSRRLHTGAEPQRRRVPPSSHRAVTVSSGRRCAASVAPADSAAPASSPPSAPADSPRSPAPPL